MQSRSKRLSICQVSFSCSSKNKDKAGVSVLLGREEMALEELGRTSPCRIQKGSIFIPTVSIRPQTRCLQPKRSPAKPILPAALNYSKFPKRKTRNSLLRMSTLSNKHKTFNLDSSDPRSTIVRHALSMQSGNKQPANRLGNCVTVGSRERLGRYSQISEARIARKIKTIQTLQYTDS